MINHELLTTVYHEFYGEGKGEDGEPVIIPKTDGVTLAVFDGIGSCSHGFGGEKGGRIASRIASDITKEFLKREEFNAEKVILLQQIINRALEAEVPNVEESRVKRNAKLCTTIALANIVTTPEETDGKYKAQVAWMGDSRIYFLSPVKGLQQLTLDDSWQHQKFPKTASSIKRPNYDNWDQGRAFNVNASDATGQYLRGESSRDRDITKDGRPWMTINFQEEEFDEPGCFVACTDGVHSKLDYPRHLEKALLQFLESSNSLEDLQEILKTHYHTKGNVSDDTTLLIQPVGFKDFDDFKAQYTERLKTVLSYDLQSEWTDGLDESEAQNKLSAHEQEIWVNHYRETYAERMFPERRLEEKVFTAAPFIDDETIVNEPVPVVESSSFASEPNAEDVPEIEAALEAEPVYEPVTATTGFAEVMERVKGFAREAVSKFVDFSQWVWGKDPNKDSEHNIEKAVATLKERVDSPDDPDLKTFPTDSLEMIDLLHEELEKKKREPLSPDDQETLKGFDEDFARLKAKATLLLKPLRVIEVAAEALATSNIPVSAIPVSEVPEPGISTPSVPEPSTVSPDATPAEPSASPIIPSPSSTSTEATKKESTSSEGTSGEAAENLEKKTSTAIGTVALTTLVIGDEAKKTAGSDHPRSPPEKKPFWKTPKFTNALKVAGACAVASAAMIGALHLVQQGHDLLLPSGNLPHPFPSSGDLHTALQNELSDGTLSATAYEHLSHASSEEIQGLMNNDPTLAKHLHEAITKHLDMQQTVSQMIQQEQFKALRESGGVALHDFKPHDEQSTLAFINKTFAQHGLKEHFNTFAEAKDYVSNQAATQYNAIDSALVQDTGTTYQQFDGMHHLGDAFHVMQQQLETQNAGLKSVKEHLAKALHVSETHISPLGSTHDGVLVASTADVPIISAPANKWSIVGMAVAKGVIRSGISHALPIAGAAMTSYSLGKRSYNHLLTKAEKLGILEERKDSTLAERLRYIPTDLHRTTREAIKDAPQDFRDMAQRFSETSKSVFSMMKSKFEEMTRRDAAVSEVYEAMSVRQAAR